jgi:hypothetical protein
LVTDEVKVLSSKFAFSTYEIPLSTIEMDMAKWVFEGNDDTLKELSSSLTSIYLHGDVIRYSVGEGHDTDRDHADIVCGVSRLLDEQMRVKMPHVAPLPQPARDAAYAAGWTSEQVVSGLVGFIQSLQWSNGGKAPDELELGEYLDRFCSGGRGQGNRMVPEVWYEGGQAKLPQEGPLCPEVATGKSYGQGRGDHEGVGFSHWLSDVCDTDDEGGVIRQPLSAFSFQGKATLLKMRIVRALSAYCFDHYESVEGGGCLVRVKGADFARFCMLNTNVKRLTDVLESMVGESICVYEPGDKGVSEVSRFVLIRYVSRPERGVIEIGITPGAIDAIKEVSPSECDQIPSRIVRQLSSVYGHALLGVVRRGASGGGVFVSRQSFEALVSGVESEMSPLSRQKAKFKEAMKSLEAIGEIGSAEQCRATKAGFFIAVR